MTEALSTTTRDEILAFAYRRGTSLRRRRQVLRSAAALASVVALALPVSAILDDGSAKPDSQRVNIVDTPPTTTTTGVVPQPDQQSGALGPVPAGGAAPPSQGVSPAREVQPPPVQNHSAPTPDVPRELAPCAPSEVQLTTSTDKAAYLPTDTVRVTARIRNASGRRCLPPTTASIAIRNEAGQSPAYTDQRQAPATDFRAGAVVEVVFTWEPGVSAQQGRYTASVMWDAGRDYGPSHAGFTVAVA